MGIKPLLPYLAKIDKVKSVKDLQQLLWDGANWWVGIGVGVGADDKNSAKTH
jgi:endothelin-converting enzyme/putative endopeptidase